MNRRQFLLGGAAIVAGAALPANAVRGRDLEWIGIDYAAGPDEGGYLIPPGFRDEFDRAVAKAFGVPAPILRGATFGQFDDAMVEFLNVSMRALTAPAATATIAPERAIPLDLGDLLADMERIKAEADDYDGAIDARRRALHLLYGPGVGRPTGLLEEAERGRA